MSVTQFFRPAGFHCPLGENVLVLTALTGEEEISRPFRYEVELVSENHELDLDKLIGQPGCVRLALGAGKGGSRYFHGIISRFRQLPAVDRYSRYRAELVPWLWLLTRTSDCRIFQNKTVPQIIEEVFKGHGFTDYELRLTGDYQPKEYCVQYRETDFNFVSRLMEQEGICYFFRHDDEKHYLVMADSPAAHAASPGYDEIAWLQYTNGNNATQKIRDWVIDKQLQSGAYAQKDYNFKTPRSPLATQYQIPRPHTKASFEIYDYPGEYEQMDEGESYARVRMEELQARYETLTGQSDARGLAAGHTFALTAYPRKDQNRQYLVTAARHHLNVAEYASGEMPSGGTRLYECNFTVMDAKEPFRPARLTPKSIVQGLQTAVIVGPKGEEIYTDKYGRVKVQFHWDRYGKADENSSCWIRVAQVWAGKKWGAMSLPRLGQEVVVEFLEGDPDRPLITGSVYNDDQKVPYDLPAEMTKSTIKSDSSKGGQGFNEIRFEDKKGEEQLFVHAQKDKDIEVKNDRTEKIGRDRHLTVMRDKKERVFGERHERIAKSHFEKIREDRHLQVDGDDMVLIKKKKSITVQGDVAEVFESSHSEHVTEDFYLKAKNIAMEAESNITLYVGESHISIGADGVKISTPGQIKIESLDKTEINATAALKLESSASADLKSPQTSVKGDGTVIVQGGLVKIN